MGGLERKKRLSLVITAEMDKKISDLALELLGSEEERSSILRMLITIGLNKIEQVKPDLIGEDPTKAKKSN